MSEIKVIRPSFLLQLACELHFVLYLCLLFVNKVEKEKLRKYKKTKTKLQLSNGGTSRQAYACFSFTFGISDLLAHLCSCLATRCAPRGILPAREFGSACSRFGVKAIS